MKKVISLMLIFVLCLGLCACRSSNLQTTNPADSDQAAAEGTEGTTEVTEETTEDTQTPTEETAADPTEETATDPTEETATDPTEETATDPTEETTTDPTEAPAQCSHNWKDATCTTPKTCKNCGATEGSAKGHSYTSEVTPATVTENGCAIHTCACGDSYEEVLYATGSVGLEYQANDDGTYTVIGLGSCTDTHIVIPAYFNGAKVTGIGEDAFSWCLNLTRTSVTILDGVTSIGGGAFSGCSTMFSIIIPDSVTYIGDYAFYNCCMLTSITIPDGVTSIAKCAFDGCSSLTSITIPDGVTSIGEGAFASCSMLTSITIPNSVTCIGDSAFIFCDSLTSITIPDSVTSIGDGAFAWCERLTSITIPDSVTSIGDSAFMGCDSLKELRFGGTMEQWNAIAKKSYWSDGTGAFTIYCTDGEISK